MPLPEPRSDESREDFIERCMDDEQIRQDFDDRDQRLAVCNNQWETDKHMDSLLEELNYSAKDQQAPEEKAIWFDEDQFEIGTKQRELEDGTEVEVATFEGIANVMEHEDMGGDVVHKGAFKKTLKEKEGKVYFVTDHDYSIKNYGGVARLEENGKNLEAEVEVLLTDNPAGQEFYTKAKHAASHDQPIGLSIGYDIPEGKSEMKEGTRHIYEVSLWEISGVLFPMNQLSRAVGFKDLHKYSRSDLINAKELIESLLNTEPSDTDTQDTESSGEDTHEDGADLETLANTLQQLNKSMDHA